MAGSRYEGIKAELLSSGEKFEDPDFPATSSSVFYDQATGWSNVVWKRPHELIENPVFFHEGASRFDLAQGDIGDCWFLSAAATLATKPDLFAKVVPTDQSFNTDYTGLFRFNFWRYGRWVEVLVDDRLPTKAGRRLLFCSNRTQPNEFWGSLLEKAYAKLHGSYQALESGYSQDALVDCTGGIGEFIDLVKEQKARKKLFRTVKRTFKMDSLLCAAIDIKDGGSYEDKLPNGLMMGHAYSITNVAQFDVEGTDTCLLRIRNPWGAGEWNGAWSDSSSEWDQVSDEQKEEFGLVVEEDGEFWIAFDDFMENFTTLQICHLTPDSFEGKEKHKWNTAVHHGSWVPGVTAGGCGAPPNQPQYWVNPQYFVKLVDVDETDDDNKCTLVVSLMQKYRRQMRTVTKTTETMEEAIAFDLLKFHGDEPEELNAVNYNQMALQMERKMMTYEYLRERSGRFHVAPGTYCIIPCTYQPEIQGEFILRLATMKPAQSAEVGTTKASKSRPERPRQNKFDKLFRRHAGDDEVVDARELRRILNNGLKEEQDEEFSKETCRALIAWGNYPDTDGTLDHGECKKVWKQVKQLQGTFLDHDADDSGTLSRPELRKTFNSIGYEMSKQSIGSIAKFYCGKGPGISIDDFVLIATRISTLFNRYEDMAEGSKPSVDEWILSNLLS